LFRVLPAQLQARGGQVRCGRCMHVFNGYEALEDEQGMSASGAGARAAALQEPASAPKPQAAAPPIASTRSILEIGAARPARDEAASAGTAGASIAPTPASRPLHTAAACVALALLLVLQLVYLFRGELAARYPVTKTALTAACRVAGCSIALPQRPDLVKIEASDVNMIDPTQPALVQLTATLRSYANHALAYPALDLVLTNATEHALARRIFVPEEYLKDSRDPAGGLPPRGEITVALDLDTDGLNAAGFRLDLLPAR
jgi:predicted Zn finger-like uncharacterized protein